MQYLHKSRHILCDSTIEQNEITNIMNTPLAKLKNQLDEVKENSEYLIKLKKEINTYNKIQETGSFLDKLKSKKPKYTLDEVEQEIKKLNENIFMFIIRLAKLDKNHILYLEFDCKKIIDEKYRHYAFANGEFGISYLPQIVKLPENRASFRYRNIENSIDFDNLD